MVNTVNQPKGELDARYEKYREVLKKLTQVNLAVVKEWLEGTSASAK